MTRFETLTREQMDETQGRIYDTILAREGSVRGGPFAAFFYRPELMQLQADLAYYQRDGCLLTDRERQIAVLAICRHWDAAFPWAMQAKASLSVGIEQAVIDAIGVGGTPVLTNPEEAAAYAVVSELLEDHRVSQVTYDHALALFRLPKLVDLVATVGYFSTVCFTANAFDIDLPDGESDGLPDLPRNADIASD